MNWYKKMFTRWFQNIRATEVPGASAARSISEINARTSIRFTIYPASGGYVIEHYKYNRYKDTDGPDLTIVNNGDDIGRAVEHIISIEALKA